MNSSVVLAPCSHVARFSSRSSSMSAALLISAATVHAGLDITVYVDTAERNVILPCAAGNYTFADNPRLALADPVCSWHDYTNFLASEGLDWADEPIQLYGIDQSSASTTKMSMQAELTSAMTTALSLADMLRLQLGDEAYASYAEPVTIDVIGWAFHWLDRSQISGTSMTSEAPEWTDELQEATRVFWGAQIGAALRRMLPLVPRFLVRGFGPEAPQLAPTKLDEDGWLVLELFPGLYEAPSEPPPTLTLLENSGLHDDYWPSDGGCVSFNGRHLSEAALRARKAAGELEGVGLGCLWRETVELLRETGRPVFATSYQSHEHLSALENLLAIGARITHAYPNGFREASTRVPTTDLLEPPGPVAEAMRDSYPRPWGAKEAQLATTAALWRFKVEKGGYERSVCGRRNSHVIGFQGCAPPGCDPPAREATAERDGAYAAMWRHANSAREVQRALQSRLCAASELASMPPRQAEIVRATWRCAAPAKLDWARLGEPVPAAEPKAEVQALLERAVELSAEESEGAAEATEEAFRAAAEADPADARPPLNLGRFLAKLSRPAEAIEQLYEASGIDAEYYGEVALAVGTARAQQGRLREAIASFEAASRLAPDNERLRDAIAPMEAKAEAVERATAGDVNAVADVCGTPCQDVVDASGTAACAVTWATGCGETPPPPGFTGESTVAELCRRSCAVYVVG